MNELDFDKPGLQEALRAYTDVTDRPAHVEGMRAAIIAYRAASTGTETREAVIEECAKICDAVRPRLSAGRSRALNQIDEHVASVADGLAKRIRSLSHPGGGDV